MSDVTSRDFVLWRCLPSEGKVGRGILSVDQHGDSHFFSSDASWNSTLLATLKRTRIETVTPESIVLSGMEPDGFDRSRCERFRLQLWTLRYPEDRRPFVLALRLPKPKPVGPGTLVVDQQGNASFSSTAQGDGQATLAALQRVRLEAASAGGILLSGMESTGLDRAGRERLRMQEWWLRYPACDG